MNNTKQPVNPWTPEDEREHFPSIIEWWCTEGFFKTVENNKRWSFKTTFSEWFQTKPKKIGTLYNLTLFDQDLDKHFLYFTRNDSQKLESAKDRFEVKVNNCFMKGVYPDYEMKIANQEKNIKLHLRYHANSLPYWVSQQITDGYIPMGLGTYRYGFIPKGDLSGTMTFNKETFNVTGTGYFEHVWGNFSYTNPLRNFSELKNTVSTYMKLFRWRFHNSKLKIPKSIKFSTENNPLGYDWAWALFDNGWSLFYGNVLFWIMEGPALGTIILTKDGEIYKEFCKIHFRYNKTEYSKCYDFYYPTELEVTAESKKEKLHLIFKMENEIEEYINRFPGGKYFLGFVICEAPGVVDGFYFDGEKKIKLTGICKIEPQRQVSRVGHNSLKLDFLKPPKGVGVSMDFDSHYFKKKIKTKIQLAPVPKIKCDFKRIDPSKIHKSKK